MSPAVWAVLLAIVLCGGMLACLEAGYRLGRRADRQSGADGTGVMDAAIFATLGLLLGFSFAGGMSRLDARRQLIVQEANAIGTAYLRVDLMPPASQPEMRHAFREYLDSRLAVYEKLPDLAAAKPQLENAGRIQQQLWAMAVVASRSDPTQDTSRMLLPALNEMIDVTTSRSVALYTHLPMLIFVLLISVALLSGLLAGYSMAKQRGRSWLHMIAYSVVIAITVYAVADLDYPRAGLIRLDAADDALAALRESIR